MANGLRGKASHDRGKDGRDNNASSQIFPRNILDTDLLALWVWIRGWHQWISARPYPAGFEKSGRVAKGRAGLPKWCCAGFWPPVSPYPPGFPIPAGFFNTRRVSHYPPGRLWTRRAGREPASPSLLLSRRQMAIRRCGLICLLGNSICKSNSNHHANQIAIHSEKVISKEEENALS